MNNTAKQKIINSVLYVVLALIAVTIMGITIFTFATAANKKGKTNDIPDEHISEKITEKAKESSKPSPAVNKPAANEDKETDEVSVSDGNDTVEASVEDLEFCAPVKNARVSKGYDDNVAVYSLTMNDYRVHAGVDFCANIGSAVCAVCDGTVCDVYDSLFMGKCVVVDHGFGLKSHYMNLSEELPDDIFVGASVSAGTVLAGIGESALSEISDAPHLHFEMSLDGVSVDPADYLNEAVFTAAEVDIEE